ncbi:MAG: response regulator [Bacteroidota bacterium]
MKCIIVDDENLARSIMAQLCHDAPELEVVAQLPDAVEALKYLNQHKVDVMFLDIHMPFLTGIDLVHTLKTPPKVVFTTSDKEFALMAYEYEFIVDYLVKPITHERFKKTLHKLSAALPPSLEEDTLSGAAQE